MAETRQYNVAFFEVLLNSILAGTASIFVALAAAQDIALMTQLAWRLLFALPLFVAAAVIQNGVGSLAVQWQSVPRLLGGGLLLFLVFSSYMGAIVIGTPVVVVVFLASTSAIWVVVLGRVALGEVISGKKLVSLVGMMVGVILLTAPWTTHFTLSLGEAVALCNGFLWASYLTVVRKATETFKPLTLTVWLFAAAMVFLIVFVTLVPLLGSSPFVDVTLSLRPGQWSLLVGLAVISTAVPYILLNTALKHIQASIAGLVSLATPVVASALSVVVLGQVVALNQVLGGAAILLGIFNLHR